MSRILRAAFMKSYSIQKSRSSRIANIPASVQTLRKSAPLKSSQILEIASKSSSPRTVIDLEWIFRIYWRAASFGRGIYTFRIKSSWSQQGRVQDVGSVGGHHNLHSPQIIESVELVKQLHQSSLHFSVSWIAFAEPSTSNGVDLVHEDDTGLVVSGIAEHFPNDSGWFSNVFIDNGWGNYFEELGFDIGGKSPCDEGLSSARRTVHEATLIIFGIPFGGLIPTLLKSSGLVRGSSMVYLRMRSWSPSPPMSEKSTFPGSSLIMLKTMWIDFWGVLSSRWWVWFGRGRLWLLRI